jgi:2-alkyl-3-oxoalkanoate reductase
VAAFTEIRGVDNSLAKATFDWQPGYTSWREGFRKGL